MQLPATLLDPDDTAAVAALRTYFADGPSSEGYTGRWFDGWDPDGRRQQDRDRFSSDDLVAVTHLSVEVPPRAAVRIMVEQAADVAELLHQTPDDDLVDVDPDQITPDWPAWRLYSLLRRGRDGLGPTTTGKLLARKRPHLIPVQDSVVEAVTGTTETYWKELCQALRADQRALHRRLQRLHAAAELDDAVTVLRVFDVLVWQQGKQLGLDAGSEDDDAE